ncbi:MAG: acyltransferase family protein [Lactimicrobium massiliense]
MGENTIHKRIEWIDFAKGICILLMIFGHTYSFGTPVRNFIFSFHMPLFLILSGYTFHYEKLSCRSFFQKERKDFLQLIVPVIIVHLLIILHGILVDHYNGIIHDELYALAYASGYTPDRPSLGACWFLVSLFWARLIIRLFNQVVDPDRTVYLCTLCGIFAVFWGPRKQLLQNFDVTMMTIFFMAAGSLWKSHHELIRKHQIPVFLASTFVWQLCLSRGIFIEMATRSYPYGALCILEAVCGTFAICCICDALRTSKKIRKPFLWLGKHTLLLLCIHCLDSFWIQLWQLPGSGSFQASILRTIIDLGILAIAVLLRKLFTKSMKKQSAAA